MKNLLLFSVILLATGGSLFGQNVRYDNVAFTSAGLNAAFIANATITVCTSAGSGLPCTPKVSGLCISASDVTCNSPNPTTSDALGNYGFWIQPGSYVITVTKAGLSGYATTLTLSCQIASSCTLTGSLTVSGPSNSQINLSILNGAAILGSSNSVVWKYPCTTAGVQAAISDAINLANGVTQHQVDASPCVNMTITSEIDIGNTSKPTLDFKGPAGGTWTVTGITDGVSCGIRQFGNTRILGGAFQNSWTIHGGLATNSLQSVFCTASGGNAYYYVENVNVSNPNTTSVTTGTMYVNSAVDNSTFKNIVIAGYGTNGLQVDTTSSAATFINVTSSGNNVANSVPLRISGNTTGLSFVNGSFGHAGAGAPTIQIVGPNSTVTFSGTLYMEGNTSDTTTPAIQITDVGSASNFTAETVVWNPQTANSTAYAVQNTGTSKVTIQSLQRKGANFIGTHAINEVGLGYTRATDALNSVEDYSNASLTIGAGAAITSSGVGGIMASSNTAQSWSGNQTGMPLITPSIGGEMLSKSPRAIFPTYINGAIATGNGFNKTTLDQAITVTRVEMTSTVAANCSVAPTVVLTDGTTPITLSIANGTYNVATFSQNYAAGAGLQINTTGGTCTTAPSNLNILATYRMQ